MVLLHESLQWVGPTRLSGESLEKWHMAIFLQLPSTRLLCSYFCVCVVVVCGGGGGNGGCC